MCRIVIAIRAAKWSLYVPHSCHYTFCTVVTIRTAQWSLYVPHSDRYTCRTVVTIRTAQLSLYVPHSGHYTYRTVVTIRTAQWSLYVPHSGHYMYRTVVTMCTTSLTFNNSTFCPHTVFMCFVWIWEQTAIISLYNINWLVCITETEIVFCAVRTGCLNTLGQYHPPKALPHVLTTVTSPAIKPLLSSQKAYLHFKDAAVPVSMQLYRHSILFLKYEKLRSKFL
jgi:hypothetical protein